MSVAYTGNFSDGLPNPHGWRDWRGIAEQLECIHWVQSRAISFSGEVEEEDVNPASTAFTTMISQH